MKSFHKYHSLCSVYAQDKLRWQTLDTKETCAACPQCEPPSESPSDLQHTEGGPDAAMQLPALSQSGPPPPPTHLLASG